MQIGDFQLIRSLGAGSTAEVFESYNCSYDRDVAIKKFSTQFIQDKENLQRLQMEVRVLQSLRHPNIVGLYDVHEIDGQYLLELELVRGRDLRQWSQDNTIDLYENILWILAKIASGLGAAHEQDILHRDLKPENVLVSDDAEVKITDFGLARVVTNLTLTRMGLFVGSLGYMAPELINGEKATEKSDIFSFGVIAYELLSGKSPFEAETPQALIKKIIDGDFQGLGEALSYLDAEIVHVLDQCLSQNPKDRPESIWHIEAILLNYLKKSELLSRCRSLCYKEQSSFVLRQALEMKQSKLRSDIDHNLKLWKKTKSLSIKRKLFSLVSEMQLHFPDDSSLPDLIKRLNSGEKSKRIDLIFYGISASLILFLFTFNIYLFLESRVENDQQVNNYFDKSTVRFFAIKDSQENIGKKSESDKTKNQVAKPIQETSKKQMGKIRFVVDPDVLVFVDGKKVDPKYYHKYPVSLGKRKIKLVKDGFLPIENSLVVTDTELTTVRALSEVNGEENETL